MDREIREELIGEMMLECWENLDRERIARMLDVSWEEADKVLQEGRERIERLFLLPSTTKE